MNKKIKSLIQTKIKGVVDTLKKIKDPVIISKICNKELKDIKKELSSQDLGIKSVAVSKLILLSCYGIDISWANFNIIEVMGSQLFEHKLIGYIASTITYGSDGDGMFSVLCTNMFLKQFEQKHSIKYFDSKGIQYEIGSALDCLSYIINPSFAKDLCDSLYGLMKHKNEYIRKKSTLIMYKVFLMNPKSLRPTFERLKERLNDDDISVRCAAVNVLCELATRNPQNYLKLAKMFYELLESQKSNNWITIKIAKLIASLIPLEPRLSKKMQEPLIQIITNSASMSVKYECWNTILCGQIHSKEVLRMCIDHLKEFVEHIDQNIKYLGLVGIQKLMKQYPRAVMEQRDLVLQCLNDEDMTIRQRALYIIIEMVSKRTIQTIIPLLIQHIKDVGQIDTHYKNIVFGEILKVCAKESYSNIEDFGWYIDILVELAHICDISIKNSSTLNDQLLDIALRVEGIRNYLVVELGNLILEGTLIHNNNEDGESMQYILRSCAYIVGEFQKPLDCNKPLLKGMLQKASTKLEPAIQNIFIQNSIKIFIGGLEKITEKEEEKQVIVEYKQYVTNMIEGLEIFVESNFVEVQERAVSYLAMVKWMDSHISDSAERLSEIVSDMGIFFSDELLPVDPRSQRKMKKKVPKGLDLDKWINEPPAESEDDDFEDYGQGDDPFMDDVFGESLSEVGSRNKKLRQQKRNQRKRNDPWMLDDDLGSANNSMEGEQKGKLDFLPSLEVNVTQKKISPRGKKNYKVNLGFEKPKGVHLSDDEEAVQKKDELDIDLSAPLKDGEQLRGIQSYEELGRKKSKKDKKSKKSKKKKKKKSKKSKGVKQDTIESSPPQSHILYADDEKNVLISYSARGDNDHKDRLAVLLQVQKSSLLEEIKISVANTEILATEDELIFSKKVKSKDDVYKKIVIFESKDTSSVQAVPVEIQYKLKDQDEISAKASMAFPLSSFNIPLKIEPAELKEIEQGIEISKVAKLPLGGLSIEDALRIIAKKINSKLVYAANMRAKFYAKSLLDADVITSVAATQKGDQVAIKIASQKEFLAEAILSEVKSGPFFNQ